MAEFIPEYSSDDSVVKVVDGQIIAVSAGLAYVSGHWDGGPFDGCSGDVAVPVPITVT